MTWRNDAHGLVVSCSEIKLYKPSHTLGMKLSQLHKQIGQLRVITYSLPDLKYIEQQISRRPHSIWIICHQKFMDKAQELKYKFPAIQLSTFDEVHTKLVMIEPDTIYMGSANFGKSGWHEAVIGMRSKKNHDWYLENLFDPLWNQSIPVST